MPTATAWEGPLRNVGSDDSVAAGATTLMGAIRRKRGNLQIRLPPSIHTTILNVRFYVETGQADWVLNAPRRASAIRRQRRYLDFGIATISSRLSEPRYPLLSPSQRPRCTTLLKRSRRPPPAQTVDWSAKSCAPDESDREQRIIAMLNAGVSVAEIASREDVTIKRMRALVQEYLVRRMPQPPAEFLAVQVNRLNEALLVSYSAMSGANLQAVDRVVKIVRELDRYHGFVAAGRAARPDASRLAAPRQSLLRWKRQRPVWKWRRKRLKIQIFAPGNGGPAHRHALTLTGRSLAERSGTPTIVRCRSLETRKVHRTSRR